jgi:hypothetical protein
VAITADSNTDRCGINSGQKCHTEGSRKETKIQQFMYIDTANVEHEMYDCTGVIGATGTVTDGLN